MTTLWIKLMCTRTIFKSSSINKFITNKNQSHFLFIIIILFFINIIFHRLPRNCMCYCCAEVLSLIPESGQSFVGSVTICFRMSSVLSMCNCTYTLTIIYISFLSVIIAFIEQALISLKLDSVLCQMSGP